MSYTDFDTSYDPVNGLNFDNTASTYTVQDGDTLASIAQSLWGDASYWYMLADANGLTGDADLASGMDLVVPDKIHDDHNNASTYKVYDPNEAVGDVSPTVPHAHKHGGCGVMGEIVVAVVAIAVTMATFGALGGPSLAGLELAEVAAVAGAAGSVASQGVAMAAGMQKSFDWGNLAMSVVGSVVTQGLAPGGSSIGNALAQATKDLGTFGAGFVRSVIGSVVTQGIGVATGLQRKFDWIGVAAAGVAGGVGAEIGSGSSTGSALGRGFVAGMAGDLIGATMHTLIDGSDFGDNMLKGLPSAISQAIATAAGPHAIDPSDPQFAGKSVEDIAAMQMQEAANKTSNPTRYLSLVQSDPDLTQLFTTGAQIIVSARDQGLSLDDPASVLGTHVNPDAPPPPASPPGGTELVVVNNSPTFGDLVANTLINAQGAYDSYPQSTRDFISAGFSVVRFGPVGMIGSYALNKATGAALAVTGLDEEIQKGAEIVGTHGLSILGGASVEDEEGNAAKDGGHDALLLVEAGGTILGVAGGIFGLVKKYGIGEIKNVTSLVPKGAKPLGNWGETRLSQLLGGAGVKPSKPFMTPLGPRYVDRLVDNVAYESKAGVDVKLTSDIQRQIDKDVSMVNNGQVRAVEWHFWQGASPQLLQALQKAGIPYVVH